MQTIDVHDLSTEEIHLITEFVEFLRQRKKLLTTEAVRPPSVAAERPETAQSTFAAWSLGATGTLSREEIYDHL